MQQDHHGLALNKVEHPKVLPLITTRHLEADLEGSESSHSSGGHRPVIPLIQKHLGGRQGTLFAKLRICQVRRALEERYIGK
jgi:hypothetical protein